MRRIATGAALLVALVAIAPVHGAQDDEAMPVPFARATPGGQEISAGVPAVGARPAVPSGRRLQSGGQRTPAGVQADSAAAGVDRALEFVRRANGAPDAERAGLFSLALQALDAQPNLATSAWLREPLMAVPPDGTGAETRLAATLDLISAERAQPDARADRRSLERVLADPRFRPFDLLSLLPPWLRLPVIAAETLLRALWNILRWPIDRLLELLFRGLTYGPLVLGLATLLMGGIALLYVRGLRATLVGQTELDVRAGPLPPTAEEALRLAQERAATGAYRDGCHFLFLSTLLWLEEQGRFRFDASATNREHLAQVAGDSVVAGNLMPFILRFDRIWYGQDDASHGDYGDLTVLAGQVRRALA